MFRIFAAAACVIFVYGAYVWLIKPAEEAPSSLMPVEIKLPPLSQFEAEILDESSFITPNESVISEAAPLKSTSDDSLLPSDVDRMTMLFQPGSSLLPFIETVSYQSRVDWLTGRSVYLGDYAAHYQTSRHFISRSLHGTGNYLSDVVSKGSRFNVYRKDHSIEFHLVLDLSRLKTWLYVWDKTEDARWLLKTYPVCAGKLDAKSRSGSLTPIGTFSIGKECAVYEADVKGNFKNETKELISVFGTRWIPLGKEIAGCSGSSKGLGLQGVPWRRVSLSSSLMEARECIGTFASEGCIRFLTEDIEEIYSLIVSKPAFIHIVKDFTDAKLPGKEVS